MRSTSRVRSLFTLKRFTAPFAALLFLVLTGAMLSLSREASVQQDRSKLIKFSHKLHAKDQGIACADCHEAAASKRAADNLLPKKAVCQSCHEEQLSKQCTYCHLSDNKDTYVPFENPIREITFSHEQHVAGQKVECATCHVGMDEVTVPSSATLPAMSTCNTCHDGAKAINRCESCHVNLASLRPKEHNGKDFIKEHKRIARLSDATCVNCHTQESCTDCHNGGSLQKTTASGRDRMAMYSPRLFSIDRGQNQAVAKVHDLNFKFTHGVAANSKSAECQTCHNKQEFCSTCHLAGGNINQGSFQPESHGKPGFLTLGVGSGGGVHAKLAKRDIENCASCHDAQGADPTCVTCHVDPDGIRGNNPKTHPTGYRASGENGPWHSDPGAACYVCHTDANARPSGVKGQKFCGYCHS